MPSSVKSEVIVEVVIKFGVQLLFWVGSGWWVAGGWIKLDTRYKYNSS